MKALAIKARRTVAASPPIERRQNNSAAKVPVTPQAAAIEWRAANQAGKGGSPRACRDVA